MARKSRVYYKTIGRKFAQGAVVRNVSGNLQHNAIHARDDAQGVIIFVDDSVANYGYMLNKGIVKGKGTDWIGWWEKARNAIAVYLNSVLNERKTSLTSTIDRVNASNKDTLLRQTVYLRNIKRK